MTRSAAEARQRLIEAGIAQFGRKGLDGATTRDIAQTAGVNIAGITYHFGGKEQLYLACARHIAETVLAGVTQKLPKLPMELGEPVTELRQILRGAAEFMLATPASADFARFVLREQMDPSPAFDILYATFMEPMHKRLCLLWASATGGEAEAERTKLKVFALISQIFFFRLARAGALRRLGWAEIRENEISAIIGLAAETLEALVEAERRRSRQ
jgi:TetR/AcrR family transcriptional regulator, regulator of cefoperazone and chloramphenicol sensitivity